MCGLESINRTSLYLNGRFKIKICLLLKNFAYNIHLDDNKKVYVLLCFYLGTTHWQLLA